VVRAAPMELWRMDVLDGLHLADGSSAKALTGIDRYSRCCVAARLMPRELTLPVCDGFASAMRAQCRGADPDRHGKVFTGRFHQPPVEVLFDRICRENGVEHLLGVCDTTINELGRQQRATPQSTTSARGRAVPHHPRPGTTPSTYADQRQPVSRGTRTRNRHSHRYRQVPSR
jgi:hypothetical protein